MCTECCACDLLFTQRHLVVFLCNHKSHHKHLALWCLFGFIFLPLALSCFSSFFLPFHLSKKKTTFLQSSYLACIFYAVLVIKDVDCFLYVLRRKVRPFIFCGKFGFFLNITIFSLTSTIFYCYFFLIHTHTNEYIYIVQVLHKHSRGGGQTLLILFDNGEGESEQYLPQIRCKIETSLDNDVTKER